MQGASKKMFTGLKAKDKIGAPGKGIRRPSLEEYRVFVQNGGGGYRCLKAGTSLLYEVIKHECEYSDISQLKTCIREYLDIDIIITFITCRRTTTFKNILLH